MCHQRNWVRSYANGIVLLGGGQGHRPALMLWMEANLKPSGSGYDLHPAAEALVPTVHEASSIIAQLEHDDTAAVIEQFVAYGSNGLTEWTERPSLQDR